MINTTQCIRGAKTMTKFTIIRFPPPKRTLARELVAHNSDFRGVGRSSATKRIINVIVSRNVAG